MSKVNVPSKNKKRMNKNKCKQKTDYDEYKKVWKNEKMKKEKPMSQK